MSGPHQHEQPTPDPRGADEPLVLGGREVRPGDTVGDFTFVRDLGSGATARVLLVRDAVGQEVALKVLRTSRLGSGAPRFRREFRALSRLDHPNVVRVREQGELHGHPFLTMEYVDGPDLHRVIRDLAALEPGARWTRCEAILADLCRALAAIHRRGLVHRDMKPSNVLFTRDGTCKLTDFGIVKVLDGSHDVELSTTLVGTWAYTAPEHISGDRVDHRSDLYSLGVILFAMLTGRRPFEADDMAGWLDAHRNRPPPWPSRIVPGVPEHLEEICLRLLQKAPKDRFQSAQEVLYRLGVVEPEEPADVEWVPPLVGRQEALEALDAAVDALADGRGGLVRIVADDGLGKSRLLDHVAHRAAALDLRTHRLGFDEDEPVYGVATALARELVPLALPDAAHALRDVLDAWSAGGAPRGDARYALHDALRHALASAAEEHPVALLVDDVHEARAPELDLLRLLARQLVAAGAAVLVVTTDRPAPEADGWGTEGLLVRLSPLTQDEVAAIVASLVGPGRATDALAARLHREAEGNPWYVTEFLRSLAARGLVTITPGGPRLSVDPQDLAEGHLEVPPGIRSVLERRVEAVDPADREVLDALAVGGRHTELDVLVDVLDQDEEELLPRLGRLVAAGLAREHRGTDRVLVDLVHRQLIDLLRRALPPERARLLHGAFGTALAEASGDVPDPDQLERIGEHHRHAGDAGRAFELLVTAAHRLTELSVPDRAMGLVERAAVLEATAGGALPPERLAELRVQLLHARYEGLRNRGDWVGAARACRDLLEHAAARQDERLACDARVRLCHALRRTGDHDAALDVAQQALTTARRLHYRRGVAEALNALSGLAWSVGDVDQCEALSDEGLLLAEGPALAAERAQLLMSRSAAQAHKGQLAWAVSGMSEAERLFQELRMKPLRVIALANLSELHLWQGEADAAWTRADEAVRVAADLGYRLGSAAALRARGEAAAGLGRYGDAQLDLIEAQRLARVIGVHELALATAVSLTALSLEQSDPVGACRHGLAGLDAARARDPEDLLPLLQAHLARALARSRTQVAWTLLQATEDALPSLPTPRRLPVQLAAAWAWLALGDKSRATGHAQELIRDPASRAFRLLALEARALLAGTTTGEESRRHRRIGAELALEFTAGLSMASSQEVRRRPIFRAFQAEG